MGVLKTLTDEYFGETARQEDGKFIEIGGCKVLVPMEYDEYDFLCKADEIIISMYIIFTEEKNECDGFISFKCGNGKWWMNMESYEYLRKNTPNIKDHNENMHNSVVRFLEYFLKDVNIVKNDVYDERIELLGKDKYDELKSLFEKEGVGYKVDYYTVELIYDFVNDWSTTASFSRDNIKWHSGEGNLQ